ncbi:MAG: hypothetical protein Q8P18_06465 [Pseudomonadota bacterium]|nr:hypothetical protein [Pseudomonadota bacterium]
MSAPPPIAAWVRWAADAPPIFDAVPEGFPGGVVRVRAVVADLYARHGARAEPHVLQAFDAKDSSAKERARLGAVLLACRVLAHPSLLPGASTGPSADTGRAGAFERLFRDLTEWAAAVGSNTSSEERREELVRRCLHAVGARPGGESVAEAEDRLGQVDIIERARLLKAAAERERRTRELREAMVRAAAEEAAAKMGRE